MTSQPQTKVWTYEDLFDLPDDGTRYEIIEGVLYEMPAPNMEHARLIANLLAYALFPAVLPLGGRVYTAPVDVFLIGANPVQPDILVLLPEQLSFIQHHGVEGPPALVVEVISPGNPEHDRVRKHALYARAGIPEYWLVDPAAATIAVLSLDENTYVTHAVVGAGDTLTSPTLPALACHGERIFDV